MSRRRMSHKGATPNSRMVTSRSSGGGAVSPASSGGATGSMNGHQYFSSGDVTPGCTDYTPRAEQLLKQFPTFAAPRAVRFYPLGSGGVNKGLPIRPHVYEDPNSRTFRRSNSGSFNRAKRFSSPVEDARVQEYMSTLKAQCAYSRSGASSCSKFVTTS